VGDGYAGGEQVMVAAVTVRLKPDTTYDTK